MINSVSNARHPTETRADYLARRFAAGKAIEHYLRNPKPALVSSSKRGEPNGRPYVNVPDVTHKAHYLPMLNPATGALMLDRQGSPVMTGTLRDYGTLIKGEARSWPTRSRTLATIEK